MQNTKTEIRDAFWDTAPFLFSVFFTFLDIDTLTKEDFFGSHDWDLLVHLFSSP